MLASWLTRLPQQNILYVERFFVVLVLCRNCKTFMRTVCKGRMWTVIKFCFCSVNWVIVKTFGTTGWLARTTIIRSIFSTINFKGAYLKFAMSVRLSLRISSDNSCITATMNFIILTLCRFIIRQHFATFDYYRMKIKGKVNPCTGTEALYRPYGP